MESNIFLKKFAYSQVFLTKKSKIFKINSLARQQANCHSSQFDALLERCYLSDWKRAALRRSLSTGFNWFSIGNFHLFIGSPNHFRLLKSIRLGRLFSGLIATRWSTHRPVTFDVLPISSIWRKFILEKNRRPKDWKRQKNHLSAGDFYRRALDSRIPKYWRKEFRGKVWRDFGGQHPYWISSSDSIVLKNSPNVTR